MPLPTTNDTVHVSGLYPDRVRVNFRYRFPATPSYQMILGAMDALSFTRIDGSLHFRGEFQSLQYTPSCITPFVSVPGDRAFLNIYVDVNPLVHLHHERTDYEGEQALDNRDNWLHPAVVRRSNSHVWERVTELITLYESVACEFADEIARRVELPAVGMYQGITIDRMEVTRDISSSAPIVDVLRLRLAFQGAFADTRVNALPAVSERIEGDVLILHGTLRRGIVFRLYPKTQRRLRLECEFHAAGFSSFQLARDLGRYDYDFGTLFRAAARRVVPTFNTVLSDARDHIVSVAPIDFVLGVAGTVRDTEFARSLIAHLVTNGHVTSRFGSSRLRRLTERGFLERQNHGLYRVAGQWRSCVAALHTEIAEDRPGFFEGPGV